MNSNGVVSKRIADYWAEFYINDKHCSLCGNQGLIDTRAVQTTTGKSVGRKNFCICPNGQAIRKHMINETGNRQVLPED